MSQILRYSSQSLYRSPFWYLKASILSSLHHQPCSYFAPKAKQTACSSQQRHLFGKNERRKDAASEFWTKTSMYDVHKIRSGIRRGHKKRGFLIYRCDYSNDEDWKQFLSVLHYETERELKLLNAECLKETLEVTVKEDRNTLDGATTDQVRNMFKDWVSSDEARVENNNTSLYALHRYPRYSYCVYVDADSINSVVHRAPQPPNIDFDEIAYVTLVRLNQDEYLDGYAEPTGDSYEELDEDEEQGWDDKEEEVKVPHILHWPRII